MSIPIYLDIYTIPELEEAVNDSNPEDPNRLHIRMHYTTKEMIKSLITTLSDSRTRIVRLRLDLGDIELIKSKPFKELIQKLDPNVLRYLELEFPWNTTQEQVNNALLESGIADIAYYPIVIHNPKDHDLDKTFIEKNINNVHLHQQQPIKVKNLDKPSAEDPNLPRIKLKDLISNQELRHDDNLVSIDVAVESETHIEAEIDIEADVQVEAQSEFYTGPLYDYAKFKQHTINSAASEARNAFPTGWSVIVDNIQQELFVQLPCAIQYVTPAAADKLHTDFSQIMSFNPDNLPPGMFLQKTKEGALVLDYTMGHERNYNQFTPMDTLRYDEGEDKYFNDSLLPEEFQQIIKNYEYILNLETRCYVNLYVRYGKQKLSDFLQLFDVDNVPENKILRQCLESVQKKYVESYRQCDFMVEGTWFEECIERIKHEKDNAKLSCLTSLINASQNARYDLESTLNSFDSFWETIKELTPENQLDKIKFTELSIHELRHKAGIPPVVAMERLLTILRNARDKTSQIDYLNEVSSGAFKAYYASQYEGFSMVHKDMDISWSPNEYSMYYFTEWPSNLSYFKNTFILLNEELYYITPSLQRKPISYTTYIPMDCAETVFEKHGKRILKTLKEQQFLQLHEDILFFITEHVPEPIPFNQHAKLYQVDLSTLRDLALKEDIIYYPKYYSLLHRYMGQQHSGISYGDFRGLTSEYDFKHKDKAIAFALLFFITDINYDKKLGITSLIQHLKKLKPEVLNSFAETLYTLWGRGILFNNEEGLKLVNELLTANDKKNFLEELGTRELILTEYDDLLKKYKTIDNQIKKEIKKRSIDIQTVPILLNALQNFSPNYQLQLFDALKSELHRDIEPLCHHITQLRVAALPPEYIAHYIRLKDLSCETIIERFTQDPHDPILSYIFSSYFTGTSADANKLLSLSSGNLNKHKIVALIKNNPILNYINDSMVLDILAKSYDTLLPGQKLKEQQWKELIHSIVSLKNPEILVNLYSITAPNSISLYDALKNNRLETLEREPFGPRDDAIHFDISQAERVINSCKDLSNDTVYSYKYRKQLMESLLFVNDIGYKLPIFDGKTAKELSNAEIQACFLGLKNKTVLQDLTPYQQRLIALALVREAMYRSTGQMAYSTQLIAIIDCFMHPGHVLSNIDTGQGKSLIDMARAAVLWLDSDRVDMTTSSIEDARRDLENFSPFLSFLNIPHGKNPITSQSEFSDFSLNGINISTFAELSLFQAKMKLAATCLGKDTDVVSLIINESDYSLLEDRTIYRFATQNAEGLTSNVEWIYTAINEFVVSPSFVAKNTSAQRDVLNLKAFVLNYTKEHNKKSNIVSHIHSEQWLKWIDAALLVQYKLKENFDFIIPEEQQAVRIRGKKHMSHVVKLLMSEGKVKTKVSDNAKFGNGVQQLLYAALNKKYTDKNFIIEPETTPILSSNNRNLMEHYLKRKQVGFIWGSSGTVGSPHERQELHAKYDIDFSKIPPHQEKLIDTHDAQFFKDHNSQFDAIAQKMASVTLDNKAKPQLIFCKDINSAKKLYAFLLKTHPDNVQVFTGSENEKACIAKAALGGMITVCTAAIGRNTDILYDRAIGMNVLHTSINSYNLEAQLTGRTGRQGSSGEIDFYFNEAELQGKTKQAIQDEIYQNSLKDRAFHEELYSILGNVLTQLEQQTLKPNTVEFLNKTWSKLSVKYEKLYKELKITQEYDRDAFISKIVEDLREFNLNKQDILNALNQQFEAKAPYNPYTTPITLEECHTPVEIAYMLLNKEKSQSTLTDDVREQIKNKVYKLLNKYTNSKTTSYHADYINYVTQNGATQHEIRAIHQDCIQQFLNQQSELPWYKRLFGFQSSLNEVVNSGNYLTLFRALMSVPCTTADKKSELALVKNTTIALIKEYQSMWFINNQRQQLATQLIQDIGPMNDLSELIKMLDKYQLDLAKKDIEINKTRTWFPLHNSGSSRLQNTLSSALNLASSLHDKETDNYKELVETLEHADERNKKVIEDQLALSIKNRNPSSLFSPVEKSNKKEENLDLDNVLKKIKP